MQTEKLKGLINLNRNSECPECEKKSITQVNGERFCTKCGLITQKNQIQTQETRTFSDKQLKNKRRTGSPVSYQEAHKGFNTKIGYSADFKNMSEQKAQQYYRIRKWDNRNSNSVRNQAVKLRILKIYGSRLNLPEQVKEEAGRITVKAYKKGLFIGRKTEDVVLGIIHLVTRERGETYSLRELAEFSDSDKSDIAGAYRKVFRELDKSYKPVRPSSMIPRYASKMDVPTVVMLDALRLAEETEREPKLSSKSPTTLVACYIYLSSQWNNDDNPLTQEEISDHVGCSKVSIRDSYGEILELMDLEEEFDERRDWSHSSTEEG